MTQIDEMPGDDAAKALVTAVEAVAEAEEAAEAKAEAEAAEAKEPRGAATVHITGATPVGHTRVGGTYDRQEELVNGRPAYVHREDPGSMLWHADGFWRIGRAAKLGTGACRAVEAKPHCLCPTESQVPEAVTAWLVY